MCDTIRLFAVYRVKMVAIATILTRDHEMSLAEGSLRAFECGSSPGKSAGKTWNMLRLRVRLKGVKEIVEASWVVGVMGHL